MIDEVLIIKKDGVIQPMFRSITILFRDIKNSFLSLFGRAVERDTYNLDVSLAKWIVPRLICLKKNRSIYLEDNGFLTELDKMINAFTIISSDDFFDLTEEQSLIIKEGLSSFHENFYRLWW